MGGLPTTEGHPRKGRVLRPSPGRRDDWPSSRRPGLSPTSGGYRAPGFRVPTPLWKFWPTFASEVVDAAGPTGSICPDGDLAVESHAIPTDRCSYAGPRKPRGPALVCAGIGECQLSAPPSSQRLRRIHSGKPKLWGRAGTAFGAPLGGLGAPRLNTRATRGPLRRAPVVPRRGASRRRRLGRRLLGLVASGEQMARRGPKPQRTPAPRATSEGGRDESGPDGRSFSEGPRVISREGRTAAPPADAEGHGTRRPGPNQERIPAPTPRRRHPDQGVTSSVVITTSSSSSGPTSSAGSPAR
jgi:hypothetical protein